MNLATETATINGDARRAAFSWHLGCGNKRVNNYGYFYNICEAAKRSGLSAKMIRHYEQAGLLQQPPSTAAGYRLYNTEQLNQLRFIHQARQLGFSLVDIQSLLQLWQNPQRESRLVKQLATIADKIAELKQMQQVLTELANHCRGDSSPDCRILCEWA